MSFLGTIWSQPLTLSAEHRHDAGCCGYSHTRSLVMANETESVLRVRRSPSSTSTEITRAHEKAKIG